MKKNLNFTHRSEAHSRTSSNSSSVAIRKRAKAEAAQAKLEFAMMEADLQKQKAYIEEQEKLQIRRLFTSVSIQDASKAELHKFFDASEQAIAAVATLSSSDGIVRKVCVYIIREGKPVVYIPSIRRTCTISLRVKHFVIDLCYMIDTHDNNEQFGIINDL
ncbi:unnamed protein product [Mytilus coruscus]|uniref:Uncharacterized protein n=1 Tax=Mytilus coruscus TaxID=42192 RepID=A0A6J8C433_MYTCO|nr:unnamed protein product [Mytilus coruscus]